MTNLQYSKSGLTKSASNAPSIEDRLMKVAEVAYFLGISTRSVWRLIAAGEFPNRVKMRRCVRLPRSDVSAYVEKSKQS
jgi:excisionase family DNA binding protein